MSKPLVQLEGHHLVLQRVAHCLSALALHPDQQLQTCHPDYHTNSKRVHHLTSIYLPFRSSTRLLFASLQLANFSSSQTRHRDLSLPDATWVQNKEQINY
ncbi:hypothetical protein Hanom_Chr17g01559721 [Helianthus anomalus]